MMQVSKTISSDGITVEISVFLTDIFCEYSVFIMKKLINIKTIDFFFIAISIIIKKVINNIVKLPKMSIKTN